MDQTVWALPGSEREGDGLSSVALAERPASEFVYNPWAAAAGEHPSVAARMDLVCRPLVAVWSTMSVASSYDGLTAGEGLVAAVTGQGPQFPQEWVDVAFNVARHSDTWTAHH